MIKPVSSACNMRCKYCFYADEASRRSVPSFGRMTEETSDAVLAHLFADLEPGDHLTVAFQGGEPTLAGLDYFRHFVDETGKYAGKGVEVDYALQTNGLLLDDAWCAFLREKRFLVGLSLDGPAEFHNGNRLDADLRGTFRRVAEAKERMDRHGVEYNLLTVLTNQLARHPKQIWKFLLDQGVNFVQFIPCLGPLEGEGGGYALTPERYASFYTALYALWEQEYRGGHYVSVKLFDDLINLLAFGRCNACGLLGRCQAQLIVEADGGVYPCDFYVLDEWRVGSLKEQSLRAVYESPGMERFLRREAEQPPGCGGCPYRAMCNGGCKRMRAEVFCAASDGTCGHRLLLDACGERLENMALLFRRAAVPPR